MSGSRPAAFAFAGSLALHLLLLALVALQLVLASRFPDLLPPRPAPEPTVVTIEMPEFLKPPEPPAPDDPPEDEILLPADQKALLKARRDYVRTTQNEREDAAPEDAAFISDRNTTAASELPPSATPDRPDLPSQAGAEPPIAIVELATREFVDGRLADDATTGENGPESRVPPPPSATPTPPSPAVAQAAESQAQDPSDPAPPPREPVDGIPEEARPPVRRPAEAAAEAPRADADSLLAMAAPPPPRENLRDLPADADATPMALATAEATPPRPPVDPADNEAPEPLEPSEISLADAAAMAAAARPAPAPPPVPQPRTQPRPGSPDAPEPDVFQPHTRRTHFEGGISNRGKSAVSAADTAVGRYGKAVSQAIERRWHLYRMDHADFVNYGSIKLQFQIDGDGRPLNIRIVENSANAVMTDFTLNAVLHAAIPPIPKEVSEILEDGKFNITYDIIVY